MINPSLCRLFFYIRMRFGTMNISINTKLTERKSLARTIVFSYLRTLGVALANAFSRRSDHERAWNSEPNASHPIR